MPKTDIQRAMRARVVEWDGTSGVLRSWGDVARRLRKRETDIMTALMALEELPENWKRCKGCNIPKHAMEFALYGQESAGRRPRCKHCVNEKSRERYHRGYVVNTIISMKWVRRHDD